MAREKWTTVGKKSKQNGAASYKDIFPEGTSLADATTFDVFRESDKKPIKHDPKKSDSKIPRPKRDSDKADTEPKKPTKKSLESDMFGFDLRAVSGLAKKNFPGKPALILGYVGSSLNNKLVEYSMSAPVHPKKPADYPFRLLSEPSQQILLETAGKCGKEDVKMLLADILAATLNDMKLSKAVWGYQTITQALAFTHPEVFLVNLDNYQSHILKYKNHATASQAALWCLAQAGTRDFTIGLKVWLRLMLPLLGLKNLGQYAVNCLVALLKMGDERQELSSTYGLIDIKQYFLILDGVYSNNNFPSDVQQKLQNSYAMLSDIALAPGPKRMLSQFFPSFLTRLSLDNSKELREELISKLTLCLQDKASLKAWSQVYDKHLVHSRILLEHMTANWRQLCKTINQKALSEFLKMCLLKHESLNTADAQLAQSACQSLVEMVVLHQPSFGLSSTSSSCCGLVLKLFFFTLLLCGGLLAVDVYINSSYADSQTAHALKTVGADVHINSAAQLAKSYANQAASYLVKNVPLWIDYIWTASKPTLTVMYERTSDGVNYLIVGTQPARQWIIINVPLFIDWVIMHPCWGHLYHYTSQALLFIQPYTDTLLTTLSTSINQAYEFVERKLA